MRHSRNGASAPTLAGLAGLLTFRSRPVNGQAQVEHHGRARLIDMSHGMFLFVDVETGIDFWLHADEIVEFTTTGGAL